MVPEPGGSAPTRTELDSDSDGGSAAGPRPAAAAPSHWPARVRAGAARAATRVRTAALVGRLRRNRYARATGAAVGVLFVVLAGSALGTALVPSVQARVGPLHLDVRVVPSIDPGVQLLLPPAGRVSFDTHLAPVAVEAGISQVDLEAARALIASPDRFHALQARAPDVMRRATFEAGALAAGYALAGSVLLSLLVYRRHWRRTGQVAATLAGILVVTAATTGLTFDSDRFAQPRFDGLLSQAPYVATQTSALIQRLESYRSGLADIVQSITTLYAKSGDLPVLPGNLASGDVITVLHVSDMHLNPLGFDLTQRLVRQFGVSVVVDTGDITSWGTEVESATLARIGAVKVPYVFVRGNHDSALTQQAVAGNPNAVVLDGRVAEVGGLVFAGLGDPRFTPDSAITLPTDSGTPGTAGTGTPGAAGTGTSGTGPSGTGPAGTAPRPSTAPEAVVPGEDPELIEGRRLAALIRDWNAAHPGKPVDVAAFHEPAGTEALDGVVPLALAGHVHQRSVRVDPNGTRVMVEGSTGGAGFDSLKPSEGKPVPLTATVLYFARSGERAGRLVGYDEVTVGGFGLASVSLVRTVVRPGTGAGLAPGQLAGTAACPASSTSASGSATGRSAGAAAGSVTGSASGSASVPCPSPP
jgi:hypothetical protein